MTKEEKIKEAWGEFYKYPRSNGWDSLDKPPSDLNLFDVKEELCTDIFPFDSIRNIYRPKSLQGIENNNGWQKIESEADLPKEDGKFLCYHTDGYSTERYYFTFGKSFSEFDSEILNQKDITHYKPVDKHLPPIY